MTKYAVVELDSAETKSKGGVVIDIVNWWDASWGIPEDTNVIKPYSEQDSKYVAGKHKLINIDNNPNVQKGWILGDKTQVLRDPNT